MNEILTQSDIDSWLQEASVDGLQVEQPVVPSTTLPLPMEQVRLGAEPRLSKLTRLEQERMVARRERRKAAAKARAKHLPRGRYHHKSKEATRKRNARKRWAEQPLKSLCYGHGVWDISQEQWDQKIRHLWTMYNPLDLTVKRRWGYGTREKPYTIYDIDVRHRKHGLLYRGQDQLIYDSSQPNGLDIEKAPEGAMLFEEPLALSLKALKKAITIKAIEELL